MPAGQVTTFLTQMPSWKWVPPGQPCGCTIGGGFSVAGDGYTSTVLVSGVTATGNSAPYDQGGGGIVQNLGSGATVTITASTFTDNSANVGGGLTVAFSDETDLSVTDSTFSGNEAVQIVRGEGSYAYGGVGGGLFREWPEFVGVGDNLGLGQQPAVHLHALAELHEVRRGIKSGAVAGGAQHRLDHRRHRALAVGARHMDHRVAALGMPDGRRQPLHAVDAELHAPGLQSVEVFLDGRVVGERVSHGFQAMRRMR